MKHLASHYRSSLVIDRDENDQDVTIAIDVKRLTDEEVPGFMADFQKLNDPPSNVFTDERREDEQETDTSGRYLIPLLDIRRRRLKAMDAATRQRYEAQNAIDEQFERDVVARVITHYVSVPEGELSTDEIVDGTSVKKPVRTGRELLRLIAAKADVLGTMVGIVWAENTLTSAEKKAWRSRSNSRPTSTEPPPAVPGPRPVPTAASAELGDSAATADATASSAPILSGSAMPDLSPPDVPSSSSPATRSARSRSSGAAIASK